MGCAIQVKFFNMAIKLVIVAERVVHCALCNLKVNELGSIGGRRPPRILWTGVAVLIQNISKIK